MTGGSDKPEDQPPVVPALATIAVTPEFLVELALEEDLDVRLRLVGEAASDAVQGCHYTTKLDVLV